MTDAGSPLTATDARRTARNVSALLVASILSKGLLFGWQILLADWLGPTNNGIYGTVIGLFAIGTSIANFGIGMIAIREIAANPQRIGAYTSAMLVSHTALSLVAYLVVVGGSLGMDDALVVGYTAIAAISLIIDIFGSIANDLYIAQERMVLSSLVEIGHIVLRIALAGLLLFAGWGLLGVYIATIGTSLLRAIVLWGFHWRDGLRPQWPVERQILVPLLVNASPLAAAAFLSLAYQHADKLMTTRIIGVTQTGLLTPAFTINFGVTEVLSTTILVAMYPLMSRFHSSDKPEAFGYVVETLARFMLIIALPIALALSIFADEVIGFIFRSGAYEATGGILRILIWYTLLTMLSSVFSKALLIQNRQRLTLGVRVASLLLNITLNTIFLLHFRDPRGAAAASVAAEGLALLLLMLRFRAVGFRWSQVLVGAMRVLAVGLVTGLVMVALREMPFLLAMSIGFAVYAVGVFFGRVLVDDDWDLLYRLVAAMPGGSLIQRYWKRDTVINW